MVMQRHDFLEALHGIVQPKLYLEIGVQYGWSMDRALKFPTLERAIGIDPNPFYNTKDPRVQLHVMTSDRFFETAPQMEIDLAFVDGMHLAEYALRDVLNLGRHVGPGRFIVLDDVLPTTQEMASRTQLPGDWTGDVWKLAWALAESSNAQCYFVDTAPTGTMVLFGGFDPTYLELDLLAPVTDKVPPEIINRAWADTPEEVLEIVSDVLAKGEV